MGCRHTAMQVQQFKGTEGKTEANSLKANALSMFHGRLLQHWTFVKRFVLFRPFAGRTLKCDFRVQQKNGKRASPFLSTKQATETRR